MPDDKDSSSSWGACLLKLLRDVVLLFGKIVLAVIVSVFESLVPERKKPLKDEVVLVTGAANGLGRELALKFAALEAVVVLWDIDAEGLSRVAKEICSDGGRAHGFVCDVSNHEEVSRVGSQVQQEVGDVTVLVNNAGILQNQPLLQLQNPRIKKTFEVNAMSHFWTIKHFLPRMLEMDKGHIVAVSSMAGLVGWIYMVDYCASKFAIVGMMEALEEELRIMGKNQTVRCTTMCPVTIDTGLNHNPTTRLPWLVPILTPETTATNIINAVQRNERIATIPRRVYYPLTLQRFFPRKVTQLILDFLEYNMVPNNDETDQPPQRNGMEPLH